MASWGPRSIPGRLTHLEAHFVDEESKAQSTDCPEPHSPELRASEFPASLSQQPEAPGTSSLCAWAACSASVMRPENWAWGLARLGASEGVWEWGWGFLQGS